MTDDPTLVRGRWTCPICDHSALRMMVILSNDDQAGPPPQARLLAGLKSHIVASRDERHGFHGGAPDGVDLDDKSAMLDQIELDV